MSARLFLAIALVAGHASATETGDADALFAAFDSDRNQVLSREEFRAGQARVRQALAVDAALRRQFAIVDADRSGALDATEYAKLALVAQRGQAAPALAAFDANRDGRLGFAEYRAVVQALATPAAAKE